jgi:hypothetical protein
MTRTKSRELGAALIAALCLTACGGAKQAAPPPPTFPRTLASALATQSDSVADALAAGDTCRALALARRLQQSTIAAINRGGVAPDLQEQLSGAVNELVARVRCVPPAREEHGKHGEDEQKHDRKHEGHHKKHEDHG